MNDQILEPDFTSIKTEHVTLPYRSEPYLRFSYTDPMLSQYEVTVIADSKPEHLKDKEDEGNRIFTIIARFPRCILSEVNTHRQFSRNSASSRARSVKVTIGDVMNDPYIPLFTYNKKGMSGGFVSATDRARMIDNHLSARDAAVSHEIRALMGDMHDKYDAHNWSDLLDEYYAHVYTSDEPHPDALNMHKQNANRYIEPFMFHEALITSVWWQNFLDLRTDLSAAQPEIVALAKLVEKALEVSEPETTWLHLPFAESVPAKTDSFDSLYHDLLLSATNCAQISYLDKSRASKSTATTRLGETLLEKGHLSPFEHIAFDTLSYTDFTDDNLSRDSRALASNLGDNWIQLRHVLTARK